MLKENNMLRGGIAFICIFFTRFLCTFFGWYAQFIWCKMHINWSAVFNQHSKKEILCRPNKPWDAVLNELRFYNFSSSFFQKILNRSWCIFFCTLLYAKKWKWIKYNKKELYFAQKKTMCCDYLCWKWNIFWMRRTHYLHMYICVEHKKAGAIYYANRMIVFKQYFNI